jgi:hypothetical protein
VEDLELQEYETMWTTKLEDHLLIRQDFRGNMEYVIAHIPSKTACIIEDNDVYAAVIQKLIEAGVKIVDKTPPEFLS